MKAFARAEVRAYAPPRAFGARLARGQEGDRLVKRRTWRTRTLVFREPYDRAGTVGGKRLKLRLTLLRARY